MCSKILKFVEVGATAGSGTIKHTRALTHDLR